jgi:hypothetical protein
LFSLPPRASLVFARRGCRCLQGPDKQACLGPAGTLAHGVRRKRQPSADTLGHPEGGRLGLGVRVRVLVLGGAGKP